MDTHSQQPLHFFLFFLLFISNACSEAPQVTKLVLWGITKYQTIEPVLRQHNSGNDTKTAVQQMHRKIIIMPQLHIVSHTLEQTTPAAW